jgi:tRNA A-37 threonylcarbamoyl transferase component Bud32
VAQLLAPGTIVGEAYEIVRLLGSGGMGEVYVAVQLATGRERALKLMHARLVDDDKLRERFVQEARLASRIASAHCVEVIGAGVEADSGTPWLAMELLHGHDLGSAVRSEGALSQRRVLELLEQICHAVGEAHRAGIVHRDLKPENIFVAEARAAGQATTVKVLDFGIAKLVEDTDTLGTAAIGSPAWMAPEQAEAGEQITPGADVWALGLLVFWMLTGSSYWKAAGHEKVSMHAFLKEVLFEPLPRASERAADLGCADRLPAGFDAWFERCVHREARARFTDAAAMLQAFRPLVDPNAQADAPPQELAADVAAMDTAAFLDSQNVGDEAGAGASRASAPRDHDRGKEPADEDVEAATRVPAVAPHVAVTTSPVARVDASPRPRSTLAVAAVAVVALAAVGVVAAVVVRSPAGRPPPQHTAEPPRAPEATAATAPPVVSAIASATATASTAAPALPPLECGNTSCPAAGGGACCWDNALSQGPPQGECVSGSLQADGCATTARGETVRGFETRIECQVSAHCNAGEVCCARLVERGHKGEPYYEWVKCMPRCEQPLRQLCDDVRSAEACPRLPSGNRTVAAECKRSTLLPAGYLVCGYPQFAPTH